MSLSGNGERRSGSRPSSAAREEGNFTKGRVHEGPDTRDFLNDDNPFDDVFIDEDQLLEYEGGGGGGGATIIFRVSFWMLPSSFIQTSVKKLFFSSRSSSPAARPFRG